MSKLKKTPRNFFLRVLNFLGIYIAKRCVRIPITPTLTNKKFIAKFIAESDKTGRK